jgi:hypothetical protein
MDGRIFARFHLDVGIGDALMQPLETVVTIDWLAFAGIERPRVLLISREQQFAEKIHAYTLPRNTPNSRVKDLVDLALLIGGELDRQRILDALHLTFDRRRTHSLPTALDAPSPEWMIPFQALAAECGMQPDLAAAFERVEKFYQQTFRDENTH